MLFWPLLELLLFYFQWNTTWRSLFYGISSPMTYKKYIYHYLGTEVNLELIILFFKLLAMHNNALLRIDWCNSGRSWLANAAQ